MDLIYDKNGNFLNIASVLPASADTIPLLWGSDNQVSLGNSSHIRSHISCQLYNPVIKKIVAWLYKALEHLNVQIITPKH